MEKASGVINSWIPRKFVLPILVFAMFPHLMLLTLFSLNSTFTASVLDVDTDDLQFFFSLAYALFVCGLFINNRLYHAVNVRTYLLSMTLLNIVVLYGMAITNNSQYTLILRFIQGPLTVLEGCILVPIMMSQMKSRNTQFIAFSILYFFMITGDKLTINFVKFAIEGYSYKVMIFTIICAHIVALFIYLFLFNTERMYPKKPLYQLRISGIILIAISLIAGSYFFVYGKRLNWFESQQIVLAFSCMFIFGGLFILHQKTSKRPLFEFEILRSKRIWIGITLFFCFYLLRIAMNNIYQVMSVVWKWHWEYISSIQFIFVFGGLIGCITSYVLFTQKVSYKRIFILGFSLLSGTMFWFSYLFYPDTSLYAIGPPLFIQGIAQGILFTPLVFFMMGSIHPNLTGQVTLLGTSARFWTTTIGFSLLQNVLWYLTTKYETLLTHNLDQTSPIFQNEWIGIFGKYSTKLLNNDATHLSAAVIRAQLDEQALLVANMEIFRALFILSLVVVLILIFHSPVKKIIRLMKND